MPKNNSQKGAVEISTFAGLAIIAAVVVVASTIAVIKYREAPNVTAPVAVISSKLTPSATPTPSSPSLISLVGETADWQTYRNEKYGFEVKYPNNWKIIESENLINFQSVEAAKWEMENENNCKKNVDCVTELPPFDLIFTYTTKQDFKEQVGNDSIEEEKVSVGKIDYIKYHIFGAMIDSDNYRTEKGDNVYNFVMLGNEEIINQILSTFKFIK